MKLTQKAVAALALPDGKTDHVEWDSELPRFGLRLRLSHDGSKVLKSWTVQYRHGGRKPRIKLGAPETLGADQARAAARKILAAVDLGQDPASDRRDRRDKDALTLRSQVTEFLAAKEGDLAPRTFVEVTRYLTDPKYFGPLHRMPLDTITLRDVAARIVAIQRESGNPTAARARGALVTFFSWAMRMGLAAANPCIGSVNPKTTARDRVLSGEEIRAIWQACADDHHGKIIKLLILLGARRQEIGGMAWSEFDLDSPQPSWTLPKERSKNGKAHTLPLLPTAERIIRSVPKLVSRDHLFGARADYGFSSWPQGKAALDERLGDTVKPWVVHDTRRSVATGMADIGVAPHVIEHILNHQSGQRSGVAGIYNRSNYQRETRMALAQWEDHIRVLIDGGERKVIPIHSSAP
jgi:integrase